MSGEVSADQGDAWFVVDDPASVPHVRRQAATLAERLGFDPSRVGEVEIVVSELASNLVKHARGGDVALEVVRRAGTDLLRIVAIDSGPGSRDIESLITDGVSTSGTLGIGLGAVRRLANRLELYSVPALGTIAEAELGADDEPLSAARVSWLTRSLDRTGPCGDTVAHRELPGGHLAMVADGLGHGPLAAAASRRAAEVFRSSPTTGPAALLAEIHRALGSTRGAAVAVVRLETEARTVVHASVGNVTTRLLGFDRTRTLVAQPGIVGHRMPRVREQIEPLGEAAAIVMHSDGLSEKWTTATMPGVLVRSAGVLAAALLREAGLRRDDASVLALRTTP